MKIFFLLLLVGSNVSAESYKKTYFDVVVRLDDNASIPFDQHNRDYQRYLSWIAEGNSPLPPDPLPAPTKSDLEIIKEELKALQDSHALLRDNLQHYIDTGSSMPNSNNSRKEP